MSTENRHPFSALDGSYKSTETDPVASAFVLSKLGEYNEKIVENISRDLYYTEEAVENSLSQLQENGVLNDEYEVKTNWKEISEKLNEAEPREIEDLGLKFREQMALQIATGTDQIKPDTIRKLVYSTE